MIFSKLISDITYEDVIAFAGTQIPEGINLDYKRDFSADLAKTISAFANAHSGVVIIGINDHDSKPMLPIEGIVYKDRLQEQVTQICVEAIYPPVFPEIQVCTPKNNKTFVIIRVPESNQSPHAINNRTDIYIRTGNITKLESRANVAEIEWLLDKRVKSENLRRHLLTRANSHFYSYITKSQRAGHIPTPFKLRSKMALSICPMFPHRPLATPQVLKQHLGNWHVSDADGYSFPRIDASGLEPVEGGVSVFFYNPRNQYFLYNEINQHGLTFYLDDMVSTEEIPAEDGKKLTVDRLYETRLLSHLKVFLAFSIKMYKALGYWGLLEVKIEFEDLEGLTYIPYQGGYSYNTIDIAMSPESLSYVASMADFQSQDGLKNLIYKILFDFDWSVGHESNKTALIAKIG